MSSILGRLPFKNGAKKANFARASCLRRRLLAPTSPPSAAAKACARSRMVRLLQAEAFSPPRSQPCAIRMRSSSCQ